MAMKTIKEGLNTDKKYSVIYADVPWDDAAMREEAKKISIWPALAPEALVLLWTPMSLLTSGLILLGLWGFEYRGIIAWKKPKDELEDPGMYGQCEFALAGVCGGVNPSLLLQQNLCEARASLGGYKPQGFRKMLGVVGQIAFGRSATYLDVFGEYWKAAYPEYSAGDWDFWAE